MASYRTVVTKLLDLTPLYFNYITTSRLSADAVAFKPVVSYYAAPLNETQEIFSTAMDCSQ